jgi:hypothetical protein
MALGITGRAARIVIDATRETIEELGEEDHVPAFTWIVGDTSGASVPRLALGIAEKNQVEGRYLECTEFNCKIGQVLPEDILQTYEHYEIDVKDGELVFAKRESIEKTNL